MNLRELVKTKTYWTGVASIATGIGLYCDGASAQDALQMIVLGLGMIFGREAIMKGQCDAR
jgi:hypothetical protein